MMFFWIFLAIVVVIALTVIGIYNSLVHLNIKVDEGWSDIDTQLKRRYDLIPNLVETVKGYASHEKNTLEKVTEMRAKAMSAQTPQEKGQYENMLSETLKSLFALSENYPDLKANQNFMQLQNTLNEVEEKIQLSRRYYNGTVRDMNTKVKTFPSNIIANSFNFKTREFFEVEEGERENVAVKFTPENK